MQRAEIDRLRAENGHLDRDSIKKIIPYGEAFLFVDSVSLLTDEKVTAHFNIPTASPLLDAHFTHAQIFPGVLIAEALAQAGIVLLHYRLEFDQETDILVSAVRETRFRSPALPGNQLTEHVEISSLTKIGARLTGQSFADDRKVCQLTFDLTFVPRSKLVTHLAGLRG